MMRWFPRFANDAPMKVETLSTRIARRTRAPNPVLDCLSALRSCARPQTGMRSLPAPQRLKQLNHRLLRQGDDAGAKIGLARDELDALKSPYGLSHWPPACPNSAASADSFTIAPGGRSQFRIRNAKLGFRVFSISRAGL